MYGQNKGLDFSKITGVKNGRPVYKESGYVKKSSSGRKNNDYTDKERKIIGDCVINGERYERIRYLVLRDGGNDTVFPKGHYDVLYRIRRISGVDGVKYWIKDRSKNITYYRYNKINLKELS